MADDNSTIPAEGTPQPQSTDQKLAELNTQIEAMNQNYKNQMDQMTSLISQQAQRQAPAPAAEAEDFFSTTPSEFKAKVEQDVMAKVMASQAEMQRRQNQLQSTVYTLSQQFPEIGDTTSPMYKKVIEIHNSLDRNLQETAAGYELAVSRAANSLGIVSKSLRKGNEDVSISSRGSVGQQGNRQKMTKINDNVKTIASLLGRDPEDPKVKAGLEKALQRDTFKRYR